MRPTTRRCGRGLAASITAALLLGACGQGPPSPAPGATARPAPATAWGRVQAEIAAAGDVTPTTAAQAFSLAVAPLPGVSPPAGAPPQLLDGTQAVRWIRAVWDQLGPEQQAAASRALAPGGRPAAQSGGGRAALPGGRSLAFAGAEHPVTLAAASFDWQQALDEALSAIESHLQVDTRLNIQVHLQGKGQAGGVTDCKAGTCHIVINAGTLDQSDYGLRRKVLIHEVWHCIEYGVMGDARYNARHSTLGQWVIEGQAAWVGNELGPITAEYNDHWWQLWLQHPGRRLFDWYDGAKPYDASEGKGVDGYPAIGFYDHMLQVGIDVWASLVPMLQAGSDQEAYDIAIGGARGRFLDSLASSFAREPSLGPDWDVSGRGVPGGIRLDRKPVVLDNVGSGNGNWTTPAPNHASSLIEYDLRADIIHVQSTTTHARLASLGGGAELKGVQLQDEMYCVTEAGCGPCPKGSEATEPTPPPFPAGPALLAVSGDDGDAMVGIIGTSKSDYCKKKRGVCIISILMMPPIICKRPPE